jgi:membrane associated rhomboid family serine protease
MGRSQWIGARPTRGAIALLVVEVGLFLGYALLDAPEWVRAHLAMTPRLALGREPWQLLTSGVVHLGITTLFFDALTIWIFGTAVEQQVGRARMLTAFVAGQLAGALAQAAVGRAVAPTMLIAGCGPGTMALVAAFGVVYSRVPLSLFGVADMRGRTMALLVLGFTFAQLLMRLDLVTMAGMAAGALAGWAVLSNAASSLTTLWDRLRLRRLRRRYKVISGGRDQRRFLN